MHCMKGRKEIYPAVRKDVEESMMMQKTLTLIESQQRGGEMGMEDTILRDNTAQE